MKEFVLTQPYASLDEMLNSAEVGIYAEELKEGNIEKYAIVSRIGNRYNLKGEKIEGFVENPFIQKSQENVIEETDYNVKEETIEIMEEKTMKYPEIERVIDETVAKQVEGVKLVYEEEIAKIKAQHEQEVAELKSTHEIELANAKAEAKAELIAKLNA